MLLLDRVKDLLKDKSRKGIAFTGDNSSGKTFFLEQCIDVIKDEYEVIYIPENCQGLDTTEYIQEKIGERKADKLRGLDRVYEDRIKTRQPNDQEAAIMSQLLAKEIPENLKNFFKEKLEFSLDLTKDPMEISIKNDSFVKLTSSGYKAMIRIASEIYLYLKEITGSTIVVFIDEIDAKFYWTNREKYFKYLEEFIRKEFPDKMIKFIISSHMSETISNLPEGYSIMKLLEWDGGEEKYKEYMSNDFLNQEQVERIIFDKKNEIFKESKELIILKKIYSALLENSIVGSKKLIFLDVSVEYVQIYNYLKIVEIFGEELVSNYGFGKINIHKNLGLKSIDIHYKSLSFKEKILFNSIKKLMGC